MHQLDIWWWRIASLIGPRAKVFRTPVRDKNVKAMAAMALCGLVLTPRLVLAQGNDNITGVMGGFNGWVTSAGMYDPYTGNARRIVTDITVPGASGVGLTWTRIFNSRYPTELAGWGTDFGTSGWGSNWRWSLSSYLSILVYPSGETFSVTLSSTSNYTIPGTGDQLRPSGSNFYLYRSDGSKVYFAGVTGGYEAQQIIDPYGQVTTISYDTYRNVSQITDPSGRWLKITRNSDEQITEVDSIDGQWVKYSYGTFGQYSVTVLTGLSYSDGTSASYSYQTCNVQEYNGGYYGDATPLLSSLSDCRASSRMQQIKYSFVSGAAPGYLSAELNSSGQAVSTLQTPGTNSRVEVRGDGQQRTFNYSNALLTSQSNFRGYYTYFWYDSNDFINKIQDPDTHQTQIERTQFGTITEVIHPDGSSLNINYSSSTNPYWISSIKNELGNTTTFTRNSNNQVTTVTYPDGTTDNYSYNSLGEVTQHQQRNGAAETFTYNSVGQLTAYENAAGEQYNYAWNGAWLLSGSQEVARNIWTYFGYNNRGQITTLTNTDGSTETFAYNNYGWETGWTNENGNTWQTGFDAYGRVSTNTDPLGRTVQYFYARPGQSELAQTANAPGEIILPSEKTSTMLYDGDWHLTQKTVGTGSQTTTVQAIYDGFGNQTEFIDGAGDDTIYGYDSRNRVISQTDPNSNQTQWTYDALSEITGLTEANGETVAWAYDAMGRISQVTDQKGFATQYGYDQIDDVVALTEPSGSVYNWTYDAIGRATGETFPDATTASWQYDSAGNLASYTSVGSNQEDYSFDTRNRPIHSNWAVSGATNRIPVNYKYDSASNVLKITGQNSTVSYGYDAANEVQTETQSPIGGVAQTIGYTYNVDGLPAEMSIGGVYGQQWTYESRNLVSSIEDLSGNTIVSYTYDTDGRVVSRSLQNGTSTSYSYDAGSRLIQQVESLAQGASWPAALSYNAVNQITSITHNGLGDDRTFGYNARGELNKTVFGGPDPSPETFTPAYDGDGNWTKILVNGTLQTSYTAGPLDQYTALTAYNSSGDGTTTNLTYDTHDNLQGVNGSSFQFDLDNRLVNGSNSPNSVQCSYDGLGRCVSRTINGVTTYITYAGWSPILETNSSGNITDARVYGLGIDDLIEDLTPALAANFFYHMDASGNVQLVSDPNGNLIEYYSYNPFGTFSIYNPDWSPLSASTVGNRFYFQGREYLAGVGVYDFRNRAYSPVLGRFLQMDPIGFGGGNNLYRFAGNDPVNSADPLGLDEEDDEDGDGGGGGGSLPAVTVTGTTTPDYFPSPYAGLPLVSSGGGYYQYSNGISSVTFFPPIRQEPAKPQNVGAGTGGGGGGAGGGGGYVPPPLRGGGAPWDANTRIPLDWNNPSYLAGIHAMQEFHGAFQAGIAIGNGVANFAGFAVGGGLESTVNLASFGLRGLLTGLAEESAIGASGKFGQSYLQTAFGGTPQVSFQTSLGQRVVDVLSQEGVALESKVGYQSLTSAIRSQIAKDVQLVNTGAVQGAEWHFFVSPITGIGGPSAPLAAALNSAGIPFFVY